MNSLLEIILVLYTLLTQTSREINRLVEFYSILCPL
jgi:hypothetical protein